MKFSLFVAHMKVGFFSWVKVFWLLLFLLFVTPSIYAQERITMSINSDWFFHKGDIKSVEQVSDTTIKWDAVSLPHTWNATDALDDEPGYYRGAGWYKKAVYSNPTWKDKEVYIFFEGASQLADVYWNGTKVGQHIGGYNFFSFLLPKFNDSTLSNELVVRVDNSHDENIPPLSADFTFYGGIYRDVYLVAANPVHFDLDNLASKGVFVTTPIVSGDAAQVVIKGALVNHASTSKKLTVLTQIKDAEGKIIAQQQNAVKATANGKFSFEQNFKNISHPTLWSPEQPYLYQVISVLQDAATGKQLDEVANPLGFRWFRFSADSGFFLNGKHYKLMGASRHQDYKNLGNALPDALNIRDMELLRAMGANFVRIAHYPQDPSVLEACDRLGLLASVEIPIVNRITESDSFYNNCLRMQTEMIRQSYNHPSVIIWAYMNEVLISPRYERGSEKQQQYFKNLAALAQRIEDTTRKEDPYRYTMIPGHGDFDSYNRVGLTKIPKVFGWNLYPGWYSANLGDFPKFLDRHHRELPTVPLLVTEYGADADSRLHSFSPVRFDKTQEYANKYHQYYEKEIMKRPFVAAGIIWNLVEFNAETRAEATPHINTKGLMTMDRKPKDAYWFYQSRLVQEPVVKFGSRNWTLRSGVEDSGSNGQCTQPVPIFTNQSTVFVKLNGKSLGSYAAPEGVVQVNVPFVNGGNHLQAIAVVSGKEISDETEIEFKLIPKNLRDKNLPFEAIHVSLGDDRYYVDNDLHEVWFPEKEYTPGSWGYVGGHLFVLKGNDRLPYGSDRNILGTDDDALYQTQRVGIQSFKLDVPDGTYEVKLHFAELLTNTKTENLVYNLSSSGQQQTAEERNFDVAINKQVVLKNVSNNNYLKPLHPFSPSFNIIVKDGEGLNISFQAQVGETILNGIEVRKIQ